MEVDNTVTDGQSPSGGMVGQKKALGQQESSPVSSKSSETENSSLETVATVDATAEDVDHLTPEETCIIFDWDDTLLSSSWLAHNGLRLDAPDVLPPEAIAQLSILEESVIALLERALRCGLVVIITNAETGWVELSCRRFLPRCLPLVSSIRVVSARSTFEALHPDSPSDWKVQAFFQEICAAYAGRRPDGRKNILSFGDSVHERAAVHRVTSNMGPLTRTKSVKFVERPTVEQLKRQVDLVASCLEEICRHDGHLDLMLTIQLLYSTPPAPSTTAATSQSQQVAADQQHSQHHQEHNAGEIREARVTAGTPHYPSSSSSSSTYTSSSSFDASCPPSLPSTTPSSAAASSSAGGAGAGSGPYRGFDAGSAASSSMYKASPQAIAAAQQQQAQARR